MVSKNNGSKKKCEREEVEEESCSRSVGERQKDCEERLESLAGQVSGDRCEKGIVRRGLWARRRRPGHGERTVNRTAFSYASMCVLSTRRATLDVPRGSRGDSCSRV